jgi:DNA-directed RNA polymerase subunit RPC12/RpoP
MTAVFLSHTPEDAECAEHIRRGLEAKGYTIWCEPPSLTVESFLYPRTIENAILGSAAIVLVWSSNAAHSEWVERHILFAQRLKKPIFPVLLNGTSLPDTLIIDTTIATEGPCADVVASLMAQPHVPPPQSTDSLIVLSEKAAHEFIYIRKEAIDQAAGMLKRDEQREEVLALLEYLAHNDLMMGVREKAQEVLDADKKETTPSRPILRPDDSRHMIGVRCKQCGHVTYFDRRCICPAQSQIVRKLTQRTGKELDEMELPCERCNHKILTHVDCEGYK